MTGQNEKLAFRFSSACRRIPPELEEPLVELQVPDGWENTFRLSQISPCPDKIVVDTGEFDSRRMVRHVAIDALNRQVHIEEHGALEIVPDHALNPEKRADSRAARDRGDMVQARRRIKDHVSGHQFYPLRTEAVFNNQFAAFVLVGMCEKQCGREIRTNPLSGFRHLADCVIHVCAE